jgi:large subunit ribosomal protein L29
MKFSEFKDLGITELGDKAKELREEVFRLKWQKGMNQLENSARIKNVRKDLARVLTALQAKNK